MWRKINDLFWKGFFLCLWFLTIAAIINRDFVARLFRGVKEYVAGDLMSGVNVPMMGINLSFLKGGWPFIVLIIVGYLIYHLIWKVLAPKNKFFTIVNEGTAKIVLRSGEFYRALIQWEGCTLNRETWDVVDEGSRDSRGRIWREPWHPFGGLRWVGIYPFRSIHTYPLRWWDLQLTEEAVKKPKFHNEILDYILLRPDVYWTILRNVETKPEERIPVDIEWLTTLRVVNVYKIAFRAPINWVENATNRLDPLYRSYASNKVLNQLIRAKTDPSGVWRAFEKRKLITNVLPAWGMRVDEGGIEIRDVNMTEEYQRAAAAQRRQELEAAGRAAQTIGTVISMMAVARGRSEDEIRAEIDTDSDMKTTFLEMARDLAIRQLGIEGKSYTDIRVQGAEGLERMLLNALALWKQQSSGKS